MKSPAGWIEPKCKGQLQKNGRMVYTREWENGIHQRMGEWYTLKNGRMVFTREWENGIHQRMNALKVRLIKRTRSEI